MTGICKVEGCEREVQYKEQGVCQKHYFRMRRNGQYETIKVRKPFIENDAGYRSVWEPAHPLAGKNGYVFEHRKIIFDRYGYTLPDCEICGKATNWETCHIDHKDEFPGNNDPSNLRPLCPGCNTWRSMPPLHTFDRCSSLTFEGVTQTAHEWARDPRVKLSSSQIRARKRQGASDEEALFGEKVTHNGRPHIDRRPRKTAHKHERSNSVAITIEGVTLTAKEWSRQPGCTVSDGAIRLRIKSGWSAHDAVFKPSKNAKN